MPTDPELKIKTANKALIKDKTDFKDYIDSYKSVSKEQKSFFLSEKMDDLYKACYKKKDEIIYQYILISLYRSFAFTPEEDIFERFRSFGFEKKDMKWFISFDEIIYEFERIEAEGEIVILRSVIIKYIWLYLSAKITNSMLILMQHTQKMKGLLKNTMEVSFHQFLKRKKYAQLKKNIFPKTKEDKIFFQLINIQELVMKEFNLKDDDLPKAETMMKNEFGRPENYYIDNIVKCFYRTGAAISDECFLRRAYDLFRLILKDYKLYTEDEYLTRTNSWKNFNIYKSDRLKKIILKK